MAHIPHKLSSRWTEPVVSPFCLHWCPPNTLMGDTPPPSYIDHQKQCLPQRDGRSLMHPLWILAHLADSSKWHHVQLINHRKESSRGIEHQWSWLSGIHGTPTPFHPPYGSLGTHLNMGIKYISIDMGQAEQNQIRYSHLITTMRDRLNVTANTHSWLRIQHHIQQEHR